MKEYKRNCPICGKELSYTDGGNFRRAIRNNSGCAKCRKMPDSMKEKASKLLTGRKNPNYKRRPIEERPNNFKSVCPECGNIKYYVKEWSYKQAIKNNTVCPKCSPAKKQLKYPQFILTQDQINKMAAKKAGFDNFDAYMETLPEFKKYKRKVMTITYRQPLDTLPNYEKKGRMGEEGAYNIDHIISVKKGFMEGIPPEKIGDISNLEMIPWLDNIKKWCN